MRFPHDTAFHLRMAALLVFAMCIEHLAATRLPHWSAPQLGIVTLALGLAWVALYAFHLQRGLQDRIRVLEDRLERVQRDTEALVDDRRARRSLPPL